MRTTPHLVLQGPAQTLEVGVCNPPLHGALLTPQSCTFPHLVRPGPAQISRVGICNMPLSLPSPSLHCNKPPNLVKRCPAQTIEDGRHPQHAPLPALTSLLFSDPSPCQTGLSPGTSDWRLQASPHPSSLQAQPSTCIPIPHPLTLSDRAQPRYLRLASARYVSGAALIQDANARITTTRTSSQQSLGARGGGRRMQNVFQILNVQLYRSF